MFAIFLFLTTCDAQEPEIMTLIWEKELLPDIDEQVTVEELDVVDINADGYADTYVVTSGLATSVHVNKKNRLWAFKPNGSVMWVYGVDDHIRKVQAYDINNDRMMEFVVASGERLNNFKRGQIRIIDHEGDLIEKYGSSAIMDDIDVGDIDSDRYYEIVGAFLCVVCTVSFLF